MKSFAEINEKIRTGKAVVVTAAEVKELAEGESVAHVARHVDVVTTGTFSPMCSSGVFLNVGHTSPPMKMQQVSLDGVPAYGGIAAVDLYLGATAEHPKNKRFGGAHVISKLVRGEDIAIDAKGQPTDCYPGAAIKSTFNLNQINQAYLYNPRNCYQNYNAAVNSSQEVLKTYMGVLQPNLRTVNFSGSGEISPLLNDPRLRTIGVGTAIFCCGGIGYVAWEGTQFNNHQERDPENDLPMGPAATLALVVDLRQVHADFIKPVTIPGYGISLYVAVGIPIPVLDEEVAAQVCVRNRDIKTRLIDYSNGDVLDIVNYEDLIQNKVTFQGNRLHARTMTDLKTSHKISTILKQWIRSGEFQLKQPVQRLPMLGVQKKFPVNCLNHKIS
jgi:uncharacterized protein (DUF39 family)